LFKAFMNLYEGLVLSEHRCGPVVPADDLSHRWTIHVDADVGVSPMVCMLVPLNDASALENMTYRIVLHVNCCV
jgi:hypothetical protein